LLCHAYFPMKVAIVEALQSSMHQCSGYVGHTHLQLHHFSDSTQAWFSLAAPTPRPSMIVLRNFKSDLHWNANRSLPGYSAITALCLSQLNLHLWAVINKAKKWKFSKKIFVNAPGFMKFVNIFFREQFLLYSMHKPESHISDMYHIACVGWYPAAGDQSQSVVYYNQWICVHHFKKKNGCTNCIPPGQVMCTLFCGKFISQYALCLGPLMQSLKQKQLEKHLYNQSCHYATLEDSLVKMLAPM